MYNLNLSISKLFWHFTWLLMSSIAATVLRPGITLHKYMRVPIPFEQGSCPKHLLNSKEAQIIREVMLIMIDEISMMI